MEDREWIEKIIGIHSYPHVSVMNNRALFFFRGDEGGNSLEVIVYNMENENMIRFESLTEKEVYISILSKEGMTKMAEESEDGRINGCFTMCSDEIVPEDQERILSRLKPLGTANVGVVCEIRLGFKFYEDIHRVYLYPEEGMTITKTSGEKLVVR